MVTIRAPTSATRPLGFSEFTRIESETPVLGGSNFTGLASFASGALANSALRSALNTTGPIDQCSLAPPLDQWIQSAPSPLALVTGIGPPLGEAVTACVPGINGMTKA